MRYWLAILLGALTCGRASGRPAAGQVGLIQIEGAIGPATASYIARATRVAGERQDLCLIVQLDTPGGLLESTEQIVKSFYASPVPVVVYVAPSGGSAASAGCFITLAADVAAMAPYTTIGAAHPVSLNGMQEEKTDDVMKQKVENYAASYIEEIAKRRGRNVEWARAAVLHSESTNAEGAVEMHVVDLLAKDVPDLLRQLDGREVNNRALKTAGATVEPIPRVARERVFQLLWRPEVLMVLMLMAIYGIIGELSNPGAVLPGVVGGIALILVLYMSAILPVSLAGLALIGLSVALFIVDVFAPTHGVLTGGGVIAFFLGTLMLFDRADPSFRLSLAYIIPATGMTAAFFLFVVGKGLGAQRLPVRAGGETLLGKTTPALARIDNAGGRIFVEGEYWNAVSPTPVEPGGLVEIVGIEGLTLQVKPKPTNS